MLRSGRFGPAIVFCLASMLTLGYGPSAAAVSDAAAPQLVIEDNDFRGPAGSDIGSVLPLLFNPRIRVLGFTVVTGDDWENAEAAALLRFLEVAGQLRVPVVNGAVYPLVNTVANWRERERQFGRIAWKGAWGANGSMDDVPAAQPPVPALPQGLPTLKASPGIAAEFLIHEVHAHPHQVTILAAGPLTNVALAIRLDPSFAADAKQLIFMGGLIDQNMADVTGNAAFSEDFNLMFDPEAAHIVLTADWPTVLAVGNVSGQVLLTRSLMDRIDAKHSPITDFLNRYYFELPMWDEITSAITADPTLVTGTIDAYMDVDIDHGLDYGRVHIWSAKAAPTTMGVRKVTLVQTIDKPRFIEEFIHAAQAQP